MLAHYGTSAGIRIARKHIAWYLGHGTRDLAEAKKWRRKLCTEEQPEKVLRGVVDFFDRAEAAA